MIPVSKHTNNGFTMRYKRFNGKKINVIGDKR